MKSYLHLLDMSMRLPKNLLIYLLSKTAVNNQCINIFVEFKKTFNNVNYGWCDPRCNYGLKLFLIEKSFHSKMLKVPSSNFESKFKVSII